MTQQLSIYYSIENDPVFAALKEPDAKPALRYLAEFAEENGLSGNILALYMAEALAKDDNLFSRTMELKGICGVSLKALACADLEIVADAVAGKAALLTDYIPTETVQSVPYMESIGRIADAFIKNTSEALELLAGHYIRFGRGIAAKYIALGWNNGLYGIENPDPVQLKELIGIEPQKSILAANTERFLNGKGANNVLLFGSSGTGKSSCVKALLNRYQAQGLRLLELKKHQYQELDQVLRTLAESKYRFIIFLDDLSFEEGEHGYKHLKAVLEGKAAAIPQNVLFYATSNRRRLLRETWAERSGEDVHISDTMNEKLSLSERFGLTIGFYSPSQNEYLQIVEGMCRGQGIAYTEKTKTEALQWALRYNGRSGRAARQFVRSLDESKI